MATDLTIDVEDQPSELARLGQVLGSAGVNIEGFCAVTSGGGQAEIHVLVEDAADSAHRARGPRGWKSGSSRRSPSWRSRTDRVRSAT